MVATVARMHGRRNRRMKRRNFFALALSRPPPPPPSVYLSPSFSRASWPANFSPFSHEIDRVIHNIRAPALSISTFEFRSLSQTSSSRGELRRSHQKATRPGSLEFSLRTFTCFLSPVRVHLRPSPLGKYFGLVSSYGAWLLCVLQTPAPTLLATHKRDSTFFSANIT